MKLVERNNTIPGNEDILVCEWLDDTFHGKIHGCERTNCACFELEMDFSNNEKSHKFSLKLDLKKKKVIPKGNSPVSRNFAGAYADQLTENSWNNFRRIFYFHKLSDPDMPESFPVEEIRSGYMVGLSELYPGMPSFIVDRGGKEIVIDVQFCLHPDCRCTECGITILETRRIRRIHEGIGFDYRSGKISSLADTPVKDKEAVIQIIEYIDRNLSFRELVKNAKLKLSGLYKKWRKDNLQPEPDGKKKVGRNDPCPCGSGKKYKYCCG